jgi:(p)ppGpp synthase/HD superfamily hydrolase
MKTANVVLARAIAIAAQAHVDQFDRAGRAYILHPLKVAHYLRTDDAELMAIAVLHDVVEDTRVTYSELAQAGMSERVIAGVRALTKLPGQTAEEYLEQVKSHPDAVLVKLADLRHNSDIRRLKGLTEKDFLRAQKYMKMYDELKASLTA